jgi:hypothetical protein
MLQAHSFLWHYLWVAPDLLLFALGVLLWRRGLQREVPAFLVYALLSSSAQLVAYGADVIPSVSAETFWGIESVRLAIDSLLKFVVIGEVFSRGLRSYPAIAKVGTYSIRAMGVVLVFGAAIIAAISKGDGAPLVISAPHRLELCAFVVEFGLIIFIFGFLAHFRLPSDPLSFGLLLGFGISACVHLAIWAVVNNVTTTAHQQNLMDFAKMAVFHTTVVMWYYFALFARKPVFLAGSQPSDSSGGIGEPALIFTQEQETLQRWNRELERLIQK